LLDRKRVAISERGLPTELIRAAEGSHMKRLSPRLLLSSCVVAALMGSMSGCREWLDDGLGIADEALLIDFDLSHSWSP
jgi:hypothetical protein